MMTTKHSYSDLYWWSIGILTVSLGVASYMFHPHYTNNAFENFLTSMMAATFPLIGYFMIFGVVQLFGKVSLERYHNKCGLWFACFLLFVLVVNIG